MIASDREARRLLNALRQPYLPFGSIDVRALMDEVRRTHFPELDRADVYFVNQRPLACITRIGSTAPVVFIHQVLNEVGCPEIVFDLICKHELVHTRVPPKVLVDGKEKQHPPEFWKLERTLAPRAEEAWDWLNRNLHDVLERRPDREGVYVRRNWRAIMAGRWPSVPWCFSPKRGSADGRPVLRSVERGVPWPGVCRVGVGGRELFPFRLE